VDLNSFPCEQKERERLHTCWTTEGERWKWGYCIQKVTVSLWKWEEQVGQVENGARRFRRNVLKVTHPPAANNPNKRIKVEKKDTDEEMQEQRKGEDRKKRIKVGKHKGKQNVSNSMEESPF
jgi:hypothetical protein